MIARAQVRVTLEIALEHFWGDGTDVAQIRDQATASALAKVRALTAGGARIVAEPSVTVILLDDV